MSFGLGIKGVLGGAAKGASIGSAIPGIGTAIGGAIGGGLGLLGGLFGGGNSTKDQEKLMEKAWEYEKEGMEWRRHKRRLLYKTRNIYSATKVLQVQAIYRGTKGTTMDIPGKFRRKVRRELQSKNNR